MCTTTGTASPPRTWPRSSSASEASDPSPASARSTGGPAAHRCITLQLPPLCMGESQSGPNGRGNRYGGRVMIIHQYVSKAVQDDAQRAGERDRLLLEAQRVHTARLQRVVPAARMRRMARLLLRRAPA
jgi:hypothetical protein